MSNNSPNTVICNLGTDMFLSNYIILKCDNIKPSLLEEVKQEVKIIRGEEVILSRELILIGEFDMNVNLEECINYLYPIIPESFVLAQGTSNILSNRDDIIKSIFFFSGLKETSENFILSIIFDYEQVMMRFTYFEPSNLIEKLDSHTRLKDEHLNITYVIAGSSDSCCPWYDDTSDYEDENIEIDELTKKRIIELTKQIDVLKESGDYLMILPIIEAYLLKIDDTTLIQVSSVLINPGYKIFLTDFNNLEVKLNSLTKCIYLLFLKHPEGILLSELILYKGELTEYYLEVSNGEDYNLMKKRIDKIIDLKSNEIYVHLSRIKSFFYKKYHKKIADRYIINGAKNKPKKILLEEGKIKWMPNFYSDLL